MYPVTSVVAFIIKLYQPHGHYLVLDEPCKSESLCVCIELCCLISVVRIHRS